jgi:hypothetical protein
MDVHIDLTWDTASLPYSQIIEIFFTVYEFKFFYCCAYKISTLWHLQKFLQYIRYIILEFNPSILHSF